MKVAIIGCGLIGRKRALALQSDDVIVCCCDTNEEVGRKFATDFKCEYYSDYKDILSADIDIVIIAVINKYIKDIAIDFLKIGKYVLIEKPMGRNFEESSEIFSVGGDKIKVGFNLRFHQAIRGAKQLIDKGSIGRILFIRAHYGHGSRIGMEKEWRSSKDLCGGGELLDQGVHLIDLCRWFAGEIKLVYGKISNKAWDVEVEDTATAFLKTEQDVDFQMITSWATWKNTFSFEIFGLYGHVKINGLGGSYGQETLEVAIQMKRGEAPEIKTYAYNTDDSWKEEWLEIKYSIKEKRLPIGNGFDGMMANKVVDAIYESAKKNKEIYL